MVANCVENVMMNLMLLFIVVKRNVLDIGTRARRAGSLAAVYI